MCGMLLHNGNERKLILLYAILLLLCIFRFMFPMPSMLMERQGISQLSNFYADNDGKWFYSSPDSYHYLRLMKDHQADNIITFLALKWHIPIDFIQPLFFMLCTILMYFICYRFNRQYAIWGALLFFFNGYLFWNTSRYMIDIQAVLLFGFLIFLYGLVRFKWYLLLIIPSALILHYTYYPLTKLSYLWDKLFIRQGLNYVTEYKNYYVTDNYVQIIWGLLLLGLVFCMIKEKLWTRENITLFGLSLFFGSLALYNERIVLFALPLFCIIAAYIIPRLTLKINNALYSRINAHVVLGIILAIFITLNFISTGYGYNYQKPLINSAILHCAEYIDENYDNVSIITWWDAGIYYKYYTDLDVRFFSQPYGQKDLAKALLTTDESEAIAILDKYKIDQPYIIVLNNHMTLKYKTMESLSGYKHSNESFIDLIGNNISKNFITEYDYLEGRFVGYGDDGQPMGINLDYCLIIHKV